MSDKGDSQEGGKEGGHFIHTGSSKTEEYRGLGYGIAGPYDNKELMKYGLKDTFGPEEFYNQPNVTVAEEGKSAAGGIHGLGDVQHVTGTKKMPSPATCSVRSTCSEDDEFFNPTPPSPGDGARFNEFSANFGVRYGTEKFVKVTNNTPVAPLDAQAAPYQHTPSKIPATTHAEPMTLRLPRLDAHGNPEGSDDAWRSPELHNYLWSQLREKNKILAFTQQQLDWSQQGKALSDKLNHDMAEYTTALERRARTQELQLRALLTPQSAQQPNTMHGFTPVTLVHDMSAMSVDHSWVAQHPQQYRRPAVVTPDGSSSNSSSGNTIYTPSSSDDSQIGTGSDAMGNIIPNPCDDVFGIEPPPVASSSKGWTPAAKFDTKSLSELLTSCFKNVESAVRGLAVIQVAPSKGIRKTRAEYDIFKLAQDHLQNNRMAYVQFEEHEERPWLMTGVVAQEIVKQIFEDSVLGQFPGPYAAQFAAAWANEQAHRNPGHLLASHLLHRHSLAVKRVELANIIIATGGFWKWVQKFINDKSNEITALFAPAFPTHSTNRLYEGLHKAVSDAVKIAIRMRQEPKTFELAFPVHGSGWCSDFMIHRNKELVGQTIPNACSPYVIRCAGLPLVRFKFFGNNSSDATVLHKAEVTVGDRKENLRPSVGFYRRY